MPRPVVDRKPKRLGYGTLGLITSGIGREKKVRLLPGDAWDVGADGTTVYYPREKLADIVESLALRSIYANVGHVLHSQEPSPWNAITKAIKRVERSADTRTPDGATVQIGSYLPYGVIRVIERERVERMQRRAYGGLGKVGGTGPRPYLYHLNTKRAPNLFETLLLELDNVAANEPPGKYFPAEVLDGVDLEPYLNAPTFAAALALAPRLVADIILRFLAKSANDRVPEQKEPPAEHSDEQSDDTSAASSPADDEGADPTETDEEEQPGDPTDETGATGGDPDDGDDDDPPQLNDASNDKNTADAESDDENTSHAGSDDENPDDENDDTPSESMQSEEDDGGPDSEASQTANVPDDLDGDDDTGARPQLAIPSYLVPTLQGDASGTESSFLDVAEATGAQISGSTTTRETLGEDYEDLIDERFADVLRAAFDEAIEPNRRWGIVGNLDRGKMQMPAVTKAVRRHGMVRPGRDHVYGKRLRNEKKRVHFAFLIDNSGSMRMPVQSAHNPKTTRIELAARFVVSAITAVEHLPEVDVGVWTFDDSVLEVAPFGKHATLDSRKAIGKQMVTTGGQGTDAPLALATLRKIAAEPTRPNTQTFLILITDGEWGYGPAAPSLVNAEIGALTADGVDLAVFTIGCNAAEAKSFVGIERADEITDDTAAATIKNHIWRLLNPIV